MTDSERERIEAIRRYHLGEKPVDIYTDLGRSKNWFFKWLKRSQSGDSDWFKTRSRAPYKVANKISRDLEKLIIKARQELEQTRYAQIGAEAIAWKLKSWGIQAPPPVWTINRVLKRHGMTKKRKHRTSSGKVYPEIPAWLPNSIHQADLVGPRYIKGDGRFYVFNVVDVFTRRATSVPSRTKSDRDIAQGLIQVWKTMGVPDFLQLDNELSFRGSNRHPRTLGLVLRLCLMHGVQVIFIPPSEPWRNGIVEKFNDSWDNVFFRNQTFDNYVHMTEALKEFISFHNREWRYSPLGGKTPNQIAETYRDLALPPLPEDYELPKGPLPLEDGWIHLVRFIRSDRILNIFGQKFLLKDVVHEYVTATICTDIHELQVRLGNQLIATFEYRLTM